MLSQNVSNKGRSPKCLRGKLRTLLRAYRSAIDNKMAGSNILPFMELLEKIFGDSPIIQNQHTMHMGFDHVDIPEESFGPSSPSNLSETTQSPPQSPPQSPSYAADSSILSSSSGVQISLPSSLSTSLSSTQAKIQKSTARSRYFDEKLKIKKLAVEQKTKQRDQALSDLKALLKTKWENEIKLEQKKLTLLESILNSQN
ncbi:uncharacterized protein LOC119672832 [Teleopsis dalmanni]|uniref:uncharacterized protein LOC119672832 n=1 Tax=Teleopsis dalmanni TaxID=139649 RepID=UPI0018CD91AE|nr:uncharacterized protein LOC119672832 [Teleopsis dalmanni]